MVGHSDDPAISSRLIFRNLPSILNPDSLRQHLTHPAAVQSCDITDLRLVPKRRFAFVGYKSEDEARRAKEYFDGSFLGSGRVKVDYVQDETLALRPEVKSKPATSATTSTSAPEPSRPFSELAGEAPRLPRSTEPSSTGPSSAAKKRLEEFMQVMKGTSDDGVRAQAPKSSAEDNAEERKAEELLAEKDAQGDDQEMDDAEWLRRRQQKVTGVAGVEESILRTGQQDSNATATSQSAAFAASTSTTNPEESQILTTSRLFLRNLSFLTTLSDLTSLLTPFGPTEDIHIPLSTSTKQPLGTAFVQYVNPTDALAAWKRLDGKTFMGRLLHVLPGRAKVGISGVVGVVNENAGEAVGEELSKKGLIGGKVLGKEVKNVKAQVAKRQREATGKGLNWASLYMNSDAVVSSIADRMGIQKSDILNADSSSSSRPNGDDDRSDDRLAHMGSAVKLALAETSIIAETKKYFEDHGVLLDVLSESSDGAAASGTNPVRASRSKTVLLVKNIPYGTTMETLTALFSPHGELQRVLMPPAGTLAVVEYQDADAASRAFKAVSYRRLGNAVIYLEKAPTGLIGGTKATTGKDVATVGSEALRLVQNVQARPMGEEDPDAEAGSTLYVKNLAFGTTTEKLNSVVSALPSFAFARVSTKPDPKNPTGPRLSMGFGFVGFKTKDAAGKALEGLKGFKLDGHVLEFKWAQRDQGADGPGSKDDKGGKAGGSAKKSKTTKMIVKNLPFEASKKDIQDLFSTFGTLKSCRLPKKHNSSGRGFAFIDFSTRQEAESAQEALKHTHLLGRHLVLEWAAEDEDVADAVLKLRKRTKAQFAADGEGGERKRKKLDLRVEGGGEME